MTIYQSLKDDHDTVQELIRKLTEDPRSTTEERVFENMKMQLIVHSKAEEKTFYAALREHRETQDLMQHAEQEHKRVEQVLEQMSDLDPRQPEFPKRLDELRNLVDDHVEEEETEIFELARKLIPEEEARRLDEAFRKEKERLQNETEMKSGVQSTPRRSGTRA